MIRSNIIWINHLRTRCISPFIGPTWGCAEKWAPWTGWRNKMIRFSTNYELVREDEFSIMHFILCHHLTILSRILFLRSHFRYCLVTTCMCELQFGHFSALMWYFVEKGFLVNFFVTLRPATKSALIEANWGGIFQMWSLSWIWKEVTNTCHVLYLHAGGSINWCCGFVGIFLFTPWFSSQC